MLSIFENIYFSANVILPVFLIVGVGVLLKARKIIDNNFVSVSSKVVFNVTLPVLVFMKLSEMNVSDNLDWRLIVMLYSIILVFFVLTWFLGRIFITSDAKLGSFVQGSFRSNMAVVGFAIVFNSYGDEGLAYAAIILAFLMPLYNVLSIIVLTVTANSGKRINYLKIVLEIFKNPLIIAAVLSVPFSYFSIELNPIITKTGNYLAALSIPLALIGIGGGLNFHVIKRSSSLAFYSSIIKLVLIPLIAIVLSVLMGYKGMLLAVIFIMVGSPTAIVSYIMAEAMGADGETAGSIVLVTTLGSVISISLGIFLLRSFQLI